MLVFSFQESVHREKLISSHLWQWYLALLTDLVKFAHIYRHKSDISAFTTTNRWAEQSTALAMRRFPGRKQPQRDTAADFIYVFVFYE